MPATSPIDVFEYLDYRAFLKDYYAAKKANGRGFSFRSFSRRAGLRSPNHLKRVMDGDRNLTSTMAVVYTEALGLSGERSTYFCDLVQFGQARSSAERNAAYQRLTRFRGYREAHKLDLAHSEYHSTWYLPAIRELVLRHDFQDDAGWIARQMVPPITRSEANKAVQLLLKLGLLSREDGTLVQTSRVLSTGAETLGLHIGNYHRTMMKRAAESIDLVPAPRRDISSLTFCVGDDGLKRIKERIQQFRKELIAMLEQEEFGTQVVQLNMQLFPLSTRAVKE